MGDEAIAGQADGGMRVVPCPHRVRVRWDDVVLAQSDACVRLEEPGHADRLYVPEADVRWEHLTASPTRTTGAAKGAAEHWSSIVSAGAVADVAWAYREPPAAVSGIGGHVAFDHDRVRVEVEEQWPGVGPLASTITSFPAWGDADDLVRLMDVQPAGEGRFVGPPHRDVSRNVVEGGQMLGQAIVAASKSVPGQRVSSAHMTFAKAAAFDAPVDVDVEILRGGRTFSTVEAKVNQHGQLRSAGLLLLDVGAPDVIRGGTPMPDVAGPADSVALGRFRTTGRDIRVVDGAYDPDPDRVGPPQINVWCRFRRAPDESYMHTALMAQSTTHWTIAAAMRPHPGIGEAQAHVTLSTGIMAITMAFHDEVDVTGWLLYTNTAIHAGRGLAQGEGHVFTEDGDLVASYTLQAMIRAFAQLPSAMGMDATNAM